MSKIEDSAVKIVPYDSEAPEMFLRIREFLISSIPYEMKIEHVGSTAVVGLGGKGIIDILIATEKQYMEKIVRVLTACGYKPDPEPISEERLFVSGPFKHGRKELHVHIHITYSGSKEHHDKLLFRDYLREHPHEAKTYYVLKKRWSVEAGSDRPKYTELKTAYINRILEKAKREHEVS